MARKLGRPTDQRMAVLNNQASYLLWYGRIQTTVARAKEIRKIAEKMLTLAINTYQDTVKVTKEKTNVKGEKVQVEFTNDGVKKLNARRKMLATLVEVQEPVAPDEKLSDYKQRVKAIKHPLIEKMFNEYAPKYDKRNQENGQGGGYTRIIRLGQREGDAAEMCFIELV